MRRVLLVIMILMLAFGGPVAGYAETLPAGTWVNTERWLLDAEIYANSLQHSPATLADVSAATNVPVGQVPSLLLRMRSAVKSTGLSFTSSGLGSTALASLGGLVAGFGLQKATDYLVGPPPTYVWDDGAALVGSYPLLYQEREGHKLYTHYGAGLLGGEIWPDGMPPFMLATSTKTTAKGSWSMPSLPQWTGITNVLPKPPTSGGYFGWPVSDGACPKADVDLLSDAALRGVAGDTSALLVPAAQWTYYDGGGWQRVQGEIYCRWNDGAHWTGANYWGGTAGGSSATNTFNVAWTVWPSIRTHMDTYHPGWRTWYQPAGSPAGYNTESTDVLMPGASSLPSTYEIPGSVSPTTTVQDFYNRATVPNVVPPAVETVIGDSGGDGSDSEPGIPLPPAADPDAGSAWNTVSSFVTGFWTNAWTFTTNLFKVSGDTVKDRINPKMERIKGTASERWPFGMATLGAHLAPSFEAGGSEPMEWSIDLDTRPDGEALVWFRPLEWGSHWTRFRWVFVGGVGFAFVMALRELLTPRVNV